MRFALIGLAGYIAKRHVQVIHALGHDLVAACDLHDNVGWIQEFFPDCHFFKQTERFERHLRKLHHHGEGIDWLVVCTPNWLHDVHCCMGLQLGADVLCEKPLVINPWNLDEIKEVAVECQRRVNVVLQLRHHPAVIELRQQVQWEREYLPGEYYDVDLTYVTSRGRWYDASWKADPVQSGGVAMNIGVHLFDLLLWVFGPPVSVDVRERGERRMAGTIRFERAAVAWMLSIDASDLPVDVAEAGQTAHRVLRVNGEDIDLSADFVELHKAVYVDVLDGGGFGIEDARPAIELLREVRTLT